MIDPDSEEALNISEFISGTSEENENSEKVAEVTYDNSYTNDDLKEMHKSIVEFLEFISSEYEKNEG